MSESFQQAADSVRQLSNGFRRSAKAVRQFTKAVRRFAESNCESAETFRVNAHGFREAEEGFQKKADRLEEWASGLREATDNNHRITESASDSPGAPRKAERRNRDMTEETLPLGWGRCQGGSYVIRGLLAARQLLGVTVVFPLRNPLKLAE